MRFSFLAQLQKLPQSLKYKKKIGEGKVGNITKLFMATYSDIVMNKSENYSHWLTEVY